MMPQKITLEVEVLGPLYYGIYLPRKVKIWSKCDFFVGPIVFHRKALGPKG